MLTPAQHLDISVTYKNGLFYAVGEIKSRALWDKLKKSGWRFNKRDGMFTPSIMGASLLRKYADERAEKIFQKAFIIFERWESALTIAKGVKLLPHQPGAVRYALSRNRSYLALSPGLGKTIIAAVISATFGKRVLYICPPSLVENVLSEFETFAPSLHTRILGKDDWNIPDVLIVPDSQIHDEDVKKYIRHFECKLIFVDEAQRLKTPEAQRTKAALGYTDKRRRKRFAGITDYKSVEKIVYMSGTPMPNRPRELYSIFGKHAGEFFDFARFEEFGDKFCAPYVERCPYTGRELGKNYNGCNEEEFKKLMSRVKSRNENDSKGFMLRQNKDILGLPKFTESITILSDGMPVKLAAVNRQLLKQLGPRDLIRWELLEKKNTSEFDLHIMEYRRLLGIHKVPSAVKLLKDYIESDEKLLIGAYHTEVIEGLSYGLRKYKPFVITGKVPVKKRFAIVKEYQRLKGERPLIGNIDTLGLGFNVTRATRIPLVEFKYTPTDNMQFFERAYRIGVKHETHGEYLCFKDSLDKSTMELVLRKSAVITYV